MSRADRAKVVFEADTMDDLVRKCQAFIGQHRTTPVVAAQVYGASSANTWPVPTWSPKGSRWVPRQTLPMLVAPDGKEVAVTWVAGTPQKPKQKPAI